MSRRPVVGLTSYGERATYWVIDDEPVVLLTRNYVDMVAAAGGTPVVLPPTATAADAVDVCDAPERDASDLAALRRALDRRIPVLGVCRGHQLLNVALGGTLHQHLPDVVGHLRHSVEPATFGPVRVAPEPGSRVADALGGDVLQVWCHHHQAIDRLGDGLAVTARADDGTVEAVELDRHPFVVGVQWHPEQEPEDVRVFAALVAAAS
jgi:putative glutamine amidotransferase